METAFVFNFRRSGLFFQTIYATLCKQKRIRYEMNFKEEIPLGEFPLFLQRGRKSSACIAGIWFHPSVTCHAAKMHDVDSIHRRRRLCMDRGSRRENQKQRSLR